MVVRCLARLGLRACLLLLLLTLPVAFAAGLRAADFFFGSALAFGAATAGSLTAAAALVAGKIAPAPDIEVVGVRQQGAHCAGLVIAVFEQQPRIGQKVPRLKLENFHYEATAMFREGADAGTPGRRVSRGTFKSCTPKSRVKAPAEILRLVAVGTGNQKHGQAT